MGEFGEPTLEDFLAIKEKVRYEFPQEEADLEPFHVPPPEGVKCEKCEHILSLGEHPFCPHGFGIAGVIGDEIVGGLVLDHVEPGRKVYSKSELKSVIGQKGWVLDDTKSEKEFAKVARERKEWAEDTKKSRQRE